MSPLRENVEPQPRIAGNEPNCGPDLALSGDLLELESLARPVSSFNADGLRISGDFAEHEPDWNKVERRCEALIAKSSDLRVLTFYSAALLRTNGLSGFARGLRHLASLLATGGDDIHPQVDPADPQSGLERWFTLTALAAPAGRDGDLLRITQGISQTTLGSLDTGVLTCGALLLPGLQSDKAEMQKLQKKWSASVSEAEKRSLSGATTEALQSAREIDGYLTSRLPAISGGDASTPLHRLIMVLTKLNAFTRPIPESPSSTPREGAASRHSSLLRIDSRDDAIRVLREVASFFRQTEPANPVPLFIERSIRMIDKDFVAILRELVPGAVKDFQTMAGLDGPASTS